MPKSVSFIHLDLGIGGAENFVTNAAKGLQSKGHQVTMYTSHHDPARAFKETTDGTLKVVVYGAWISRQIFGRFTILLSTIRMFFVCFMMFFHKQQSDIVITDQVSATNIAVRLFGLAKSKLIFYCHYPDVLLCTDRGSFLMRLYRRPFDLLEQYTTSICDVLLVNSEFTADTLRTTFPNIRQKIHVLYPPIDTSQKPPSVTPQTVPSIPFFLSLNRYERKKDLALVISAFAESQLKNVSLVIAGGYDPRLSENVEYLTELKDLAQKLNFQVTFMQNVCDDVRITLLAKAVAVVYSPQNEHFGIVPCEAMAVGTPVIAWNNGGPKESVIDGETGYLCDTADEFSDAMKRVVTMGKEKRKKMERKCKERVLNIFSLDAFSKKLIKFI